jgi:chemosensory pili system protein ChpC
MNLLLPNVAVAEVVPYREPDAIEAGPEWLLGVFHWRDQRIPMLSYEAFCNQATPESADRARILILNTPRKDARLPFFAMATSGIPRLFLADDEGLDDVLGPEEYASDHSLSAVRIGSEQADIPDLSRVQREVEQAWLELEG